MNTVGTKKSSNLERKISFIIVTDFLAWIPFIILCYLHYFRVFDGSSLYEIFSIVILPINSVINPLIYDDSYSLLGRRIARVSGLNRVTAPQIKRRLKILAGFAVESKAVSAVYLNAELANPSSVQDNDKTTCTKL